MESKNEQDHALRSLVYSKLQVDKGISRREGETNRQGETGRQKTTDTERDIERGRDT